jgi:hypothetical protein
MRFMLNLDASHRANCVRRYTFGSTQQATQPGFKAVFQARHDGLRVGCAPIGVFKPHDIIFT